MKQAIILLSIIFITYESYSQTDNEFPCSKLERSSNMKFIASGLVDHCEMEISWIKNEIKKDSIQTWLRAYIKESFFKDLELDGKNKELLEREVEWINQRWEKFKVHVEESDKVYYYSTPQNYWDALAGQDGFVILRECTILGVIVLTQS
ncbi:hypothetical protein [Carboxylicivirga sp. RSCT41]|uniref:hypothetical protein n=1 Tax=Carboxylicivirga agarovorans TaxID=3417570 RepID=UPI003D33184C